MPEARSEVSALEEREAGELVRISVGGVDVVAGEAEAIEDINYNRSWVR